jgi:hypothetical protein
MKALEKDRTRRYASASEFAADIMRHLQDEVVIARPPSVGYRASRFVRKHQGAAAAGLGLFLMLIAGFIVSTVFFFRSEAARREAEQQSETAQRQSYLANIAAADVNVRGGAAAEATRRLEQIGPALRGWEWRHSYLKTDTSVATLGAAGAAVFVAFSPDRSRVFWISEFGVAHAADASLSPDSIAHTARRASERLERASLCRRNRARRLALAVERVEVDGCALWQRRHAGLWPQIGTSAAVRGRDQRTEPDRRAVGHAAPPFPRAQHGRVNRRARGAHRRHFVRGIQSRRHAHRVRFVRSHGPDVESRDTNDDDGRGAAFGRGQRGIRT